jgi:hypothetical protein
MLLEVSGASLNGQKDNSSRIRILDPGGKIAPDPDLGSSISDPGSPISDPGSPISDPGSPISDPGSGSATLLQTYLMFYLRPHFLGGEPEVKKRRMWLNIIPNCLTQCRPGEMAGGKTHLVLR